MVRNFIMKKKLDLPIVSTVSLQQELRPELPLVLGCREYNNELLLLKRMNLILKKVALRNFLYN